jgi:hypothetical protein
MAKSEVRMIRCEKSLHCATSTNPNTRKMTGTAHIMKLRGMVVLKSKSSSEPRGRVRSLSLSYKCASKGLRRRALLTLGRRVGSYLPSL